MYIIIYIYCLLLKYNDRTTSMNTIHTLLLFTSLFSRSKKKVSEGNKDFDISYEVTAENKSDDNITTMTKIQFLEQVLLSLSLSLYPCLSSSTIYTYIYINIYKY